VIAFVPAYDEATHANLNCIRDRLPPSALTGPDATRVALHAAMAREPTSSVVFWSHGDHFGPKDQSGSTALGSSELDADRPRQVFAYACHTGTDFGRLASGRGWTWWGYTGPVTAPSDVAEECRILAVAMWDVVAVFEAAGDTPTTPDLDRVEAIGRDCFDAIDDAIGDDALYESLCCAKNLWDRLRVWIPGREEPLSSTGSCPGMLY
jgi:hypothetical protein